MSTFPTFSKDLISPRSYSKLPAIKQKENENILLTGNKEIMQTAYQEDYTLKETGAKLLPFRPINQLEISKDAFNGQSCYTDDFILKAISRAKSLKPLTSYEAPSDKLLLDTNYNAEFSEKKSDKVGPIKPQDTFILFNIDNDCPSSNYQIEFVHKDGEKPINCRPKYIYKPTEQDEKSLSSYQTQFVNGSRSPTISYKPKHSFELPTEPIETGTSYSTDFNNLKSSSPTKNYKPKHVFEIPTEPIETSTSYSSEFTNSKSSSPTKSYRPKSNFRPPDIPFQASTSYHDGYPDLKDKIVKLPNFKPKTEFKSPKEPFDVITTYSYEFPNDTRSLERPRSFKPTQNYHFPTEQINVQTSYKTDFQPNKPSPRIEPIKPITQIQLSHDNQHPQKLGAQKLCPVLLDYNHQKNGEKELKFNNFNQNPSFPQLNKTDSDTEESLKINSYCNNASPRTGNNKKPLDSIKPDQ